MFGSNLWRRITQIIKTVPSCAHLPKHPPPPKKGIPNINTNFTVIGRSIFIYIFIENPHMHQNDHFIMMLSQTLLHVSVHQHHHQGAHMILTSYLYVGGHYRKNNGISSEVAAESSGLLWKTALVLWHRTALCYCFSSVYCTVHSSCIVLCLVMYVLLP
jgi:hypothetical protein